ncbi:MAG: hypothetical protein Q9209_004921 [Squamulea sp. 1 TL-2023]
MKFLFVLLLAPFIAAIVTPKGRPSGSSPIIERQAVDVSSSTQPNFTYTQLWDLNQKFLDAFIYPANVKEARAINSTLLAENVQGRVDITRTFDGRELNTEYLFGLFANLATAETGAISLLGIPLSYEVLHFAASQNVVATLTRFGPKTPNSWSLLDQADPNMVRRFQFNFTALNLVIPVEIDAWNSYNSEGQITQYDATFKFWQWTVEYLIGAAGKQFGTNSTEATARFLTRAIAKSICGTAMKNCNGTNAQYTSAEECFNFLTKKLRFGQAYELGRNTLLCRMVHQNMVPFRPDVHCPHIGKTGGGSCDDNKSYLQTVGENYFERSPFVPYGFRGQGGGVVGTPKPVTGPGIV